MNLDEMRNRAWLVIDDNPVAPSEINKATMTALINDAISDISPSLNIEKMATLTFTAGVATLPADLIAPIAVYDGDTRLRQISNITQKVDDTARTSQFYIPNPTQIYIYGKTPEGTVTMWYQAYETELVNDADIPVNIPAQFHKEIPETYIKAVHKKMINQLGDYATLMNQWEAIKRNIKFATNTMKYNQ